MKYKVVKRDEIRVAGSGVITTNAENQFGDVWQEY